MTPTATTPLPISEHTQQVAGLDIFYREAPSHGSSPTLYIHGVPTHGADWSAFLERTGGIALDLPGFGRSSKPSPYDFSYSIPGYNELLQQFIQARGIDRFSLVVHDWGGLALATAAELHERIDRVVIINAVPLLPGYRWHRIARLWRTPIIGEFMMGMTFKWTAKLLTRESNATPGEMPAEFIDMVWDHFDYETQRAILHLYRSAPPDVLESAGVDLASIAAPTLVLWGDKDPYIPAKFGEGYAARIPNATYELWQNAGHWAWLDRPDMIDRVSDFLMADGATHEDAPQA
ncbi:MAG: alpha/beta hydrolase [Thermoleophilaceae bacterium]|nr:alpha/beta hydrolase [Thermoleophilaceae bacterium]